MKVARYRIGNEVHYGRLEGDTLERLAGSPFESLRTTGQRDALSQARLLAPVTPASVFGVGLNYVNHIREVNMKTPKIPMLFMKTDSSVIGPDEPIVYPLEGERVDYECELTVVIGKKARRVPESRALDYVLGYTCGNDVSERVIQREEMGMGSLLVGKSYDSFCPIGPVIATDLDPGKLRVMTRLNGKTVQDSNTSDLLFSVPKLIAYMSQSMTLLPGDIILTGTPAGIGPMKPGDTVEIEIEGIGVLRNPVVAERKG